MVGSDKERPKGRVGSGSDNARGSPILNWGEEWPNIEVQRHPIILKYYLLNWSEIIDFRGNSISHNVVLCEIIIL